MGPELSAAARIVWNAALGMVVGALASLAAIGFVDLVLLLKSVLEARRRVMLELNVSERDLERVISVLPCMREPTVSRLHGESGYAVRAAVPRTALPALLLEVKARGGTDLVVSEPQQIVP